MKQIVSEQRQLGTHGYAQKGNRYFWTYGAHTKYSQGFRSKAEVEEWIRLKQEAGKRIDWRAGFCIQWQDEKHTWQLRNRKGKKYLPIIPHPMTIFVHKYAATDGKILKMEIICEATSLPKWYYVRYPENNFDTVISPKDYSLTESEARAEADKRIGKKIAAAEKAIAKLLKMREAVSVVDNTK